MKTKKIVLAGATALLLGLSGISTNVSAHSYSWWYKPRKVKVIKPVKAYENKKRFPLYRTIYVRSKTLKVGTELKIEHSMKYEWIMHKKGFADGYFKSNKHKYFWVISKPKGWYKLVK
ncbi:hypothetical protein [Lactobacillus sp. ESL0681]|uniref:hypothetical protein n=1 Tax=Lactobacillus sp. ESL0681 TaxID=2983211 RepID=UPI0023F693DD|nr:hypothetical protein [Lactobacillus sp. ESL0681]WEV40528.1 hypothetical protein OZX59_01035 [Lactobacillus sp. ESL0681]